MIKNLKKSLAPVKKLLFFSFAIFLFLLTVFLGEAQEQEKFPFPVTLFKLKNGLQVILSEDNSLPLVSIVIAYNVGSINEQPGKTGIAYLLENLMFQGSRNVSRMQHISLINRIGGVLNATTTEDKTLFYQTVPSNQLARVLWLESDRMISLDFSAANVERAKEAVVEEIHQRKANNPYLESLLTFDQLLYTDFAYYHPVIGIEADIRNITEKDIKDFHSTFYTPNNAVICIAGNIDRKKTEEDIRKYFGTIPQGKDIPPLPSPEISDKKEIIRTLEDTLASSPAFHLGYRIASPNSADFYPLKIIEYILLRGMTSRLNKRLVKRERTAFHLSGSIETRKNLAALKIFVINNNERMMERSQNAIFSEINKLKSSLISEKELIKSKNIFKMDFINKYEASLERALFLAETLISKNSLDELSNELEKFLAVTPANITGIASRYFSKEKILLNVKIK